jgi:hypothetical protein
VSSLTALLRGFPRQQIVDPVDFAVWNAGECVGKPSLGINAIQLGGLYQGASDGGGFAACLRSHE